MCWWLGDHSGVRAGLEAPIVSAACTPPGFSHSVGSPKYGLPLSLGACALIAESTGASNPALAGPTQLGDMNTLCSPSIQY